MDVALPGGDASNNRTLPMKGEPGEYGDAGRCLDAWRWIEVLCNHALCGSSSSCDFTLVVRVYSFGSCQG